MVVVSCRLSFVVGISEVVMVFDGVGAVVIVVDCDIVCKVRCVVEVVGSGVVEAVEGSIVATKGQYR